MTLFHPTLPLSDLTEGENRVIELAGLSILLCNDGGQIYAIENRCSHLDEPLACGRVRRGWIACPAHGARFDLETGEALGPPATSPIRTFPIEVQDGVIHVRV